MYLDFTIVVEGIWTLRFLWFAEATQNPFKNGNVVFKNYQKIME